MQRITEQIHLPWRIAVDVVLQGIRIRLGRSLITLFGVALGTSFLMSLLAAATLRESVQEEATLRANVTRMSNFLVSETGPLRSRNIATYPTGPTSLLEERFLRETARSVGLPKLGEYDSTARADVVIITGAPTGEPHFPSWRKGTLIALTRADHAPPPQGVYTLQLDRAPTSEEIETEQLNARRAAARKIWIVSIALVVTVIGICNSLLMSVTERFREIGTMKCLGARSSFIRRLFFIESALIGSIGSLCGAIGGLIFAYLLYGMTYGFANLTSALPLGSLLIQLTATWVAGLALAILAAIYPAHQAASMVPATALRSNI